MLSGCSRCYFLVLNGGGFARDRQLGHVTSRHHWGPYATSIRKAAGIPGARGPGRRPRQDQGPPADESGSPKPWLGCTLGRETHIPSGGTCRPAKPHPCQCSHVVGHPALDFICLDTSGCPPPTLQAASTLPHRDTGLPLSSTGPGPLTASTVALPAVCRPGLVMASRSSQTQEPVHAPTCLSSPLPTSHHWPLSTLSDHTPPGPCISPWPCLSLAQGSQLTGSLPSCSVAPALSGRTPAPSICPGPCLTHPG